LIQYVFELSGRDKDQITILQIKKLKIIVSCNIHTQN